MNRGFARGSRASIALLLFVLLLAPACAESRSGGEEEAAGPRERTSSDAEINRAASGEEEAADEEPADEESAQEGTASEEEPATGGRNMAAATVRQTVGSTLIHRATPENSAGDYTYLSEPSINGNPEATVFVAPAEETSGSYAHNVGVWYEPGEQKWAIFNQDRAPVPEGASFEVVVPPVNQSFVHRSSPENASAGGTFLDHPLLNGRPDAGPAVTQNWNPGGGEGVYNDHPVGVRYDAGRGRWEVFNRDGSALPEGVAFNVTVAQAARTTETNVVNVDTGEAPQYRSFFSEGDPETPANLVSSGSSTGAIPVVKPFNFGRDPGGPEDKTLYLTIPKIGVEGVPAFDTVSEEKLRDGTVHIPATGYPWQEGANVFIAGHRIGFENTLSYYVFFRLDELREGDEIQLEDSSGRQFVYRVSETVVVGPDSVEVMNAVEGKSLITLQTCTLPDYEERLIVQGELVERTAGA